MCQIAVLTLFGAVFAVNIKNDIAMSKNRHYDNNRWQQKPNPAPDTEEPEVEAVEPEEVEAGEEAPQEEENQPDDDPKEKEIAELKAQVEKEKKEYLFLMAEFDNFRKRTLKEKSEIIKNAGEKVFKGILPIVDDMERGPTAAEESDDAKSMKEQNGVKEISPDDKDFDTERHEAISAVPVPDEALKGKILDTVEKGYTINDKVLRHAKVVVGQ